MNLFQKLLLRLPAVRPLLAENDRLRQRVQELAAQLRQRDGELARAQGLWAPGGHFYSPVVDPADPKVVQAMEGEAHPTAPLSDFDISEETVLEWFEVIAGQYAQQPFAEQPTAGRLYHYANPHFPLADALALLAFLRTRKPARYLEIGAGFSSCAAIDASRLYLNEAVQFTFIEPYPELALDLFGQSQYGACVVAKRLQDVPLDVFANLSANDILFIDSSHVAKTGSDVVDYLFRILPALRPGVLVHIHDIFFPFEYPKGWIADENRSWNEAYFLRAFLHGNARFRVLYFSDWVYKCRRDLVEQKMPLCVTHRGGSLWMEAVG